MRWNTCMNLYTQNQTRIWCMHHQAKAVLCKLYPKIFTFLRNSRHSVSWERRKNFTELVKINTPHPIPPFGKPTCQTNPDSAARQASISPCALNTYYSTGARFQTTVQAPPPSITPFMSLAHGPQSPHRTLFLCLCGSTSRGQKLQWRTGALTSQPQPHWAHASGSHCAWLGRHRP